MLPHFAAVDLLAMPSLARGEARAHRVRCVDATDETLRGFGRIVRRFTRDRVTLVTWPQPGRRPIVPGTGNEGGIVEDRFVVERRGEVQHAVNLAVGRRYITGWFADRACASENRAGAAPASARREDLAWRQPADGALGPSVAGMLALTAAAVIAILRPAWIGWPFAALAALAAWMALNLAVRTWRLRHRRRYETAPGNPDQEI